MLVKSAEKTVHIDYAASSVVGQIIGQGVVVSRGKLVVVLLFSPGCLELDSGGLAVTNDGVVDEIGFFNLVWSRVGGEESEVERMFERTPMAQLAIWRLWVYHEQWRVRIRHRHRDRKTEGGCPEDNGRQKKSLWWAYCGWR